ncbi:MAG TPA: FtsX-like permease family protein [Ktedonobacterales bacterium]|nr:FtsX-like permease family protein [Ktedonobacterales bacterium]
MSKRHLPISALTRKSLADVTRRKGRTILVVLGIMIGVTGLTAINVAAGTLGAAFQFSASQTARSNIAIDVKGIGSSLAPELAAVPNVRAVQIWSFYQTRWKVSATPGHVNMGIYGSDDLAHLRINPFQLISGHFPGPREIVMEASDQGLQPIHLGDTVTIDTPHGPSDLRVAGFARTLGTGSATFNDFAIGYTSAAELYTLTGAAQPNLIDVLEQDTHRGQQTVQALQAALVAHHVEITGTSIRGNDFTSPAINGVFTIMRVISLIALLLTSFLIINTVATLVAEQTKIIGTMKAIGALRGRVMRGYLQTVGIYGVAGTALGISLGVYLGDLFTSFLTTIVTVDLGPFSVDPGIILVSVAVGLGIPLIAALAPLWNGTRITVREAIAAYGVTSGVSGASGAHRRSRAPRIYWLSQTAQLGLRGAFRRRGRAALTLLALTLSATAFLAVQTTTYAVSIFSTQVFAQYDTDAFLHLHSPQPYAHLKAQLLSLPNVANIERFEQGGVTTNWGTLYLQAAEPNTQLYHYQLLKGRWFTDNQPKSVLLSQVAAAKTGLSVGSPIAISSATTTQMWTVIGIVRDYNGSVGSIGSAFTSIDDLHAFYGEPLDAGISFLVRAHDRSPAAVNTMANTIDNTLAGEGLAPSVETAQQNVSRNQAQFAILYALLYAVAGIVALVGILGLFNTLSSSVLERRREIGILRSMGATGWRIARVFWTEAVALAGISWLAAIFLGIPAAVGFLALLSAVLLPIPFAFSPVALLVMLVFTLIIASLASFIPALGAARVRVVETLRYE